MIKKILATIIATLLIGASLAPIGYAQDVNDDNIFQAPVIIKPDKLPGEQFDVEETTGDAVQRSFGEQIIPRLTLGLISIVGALSLIFVIVGGVRMMVAYGNDEAVENAKKQIIYALVGFVVALLSYSIVTIIVNLEFSTDERIQTEQGN